MAVVAESSIVDHLDFLVMQPDQERAVVRDLVSAVLAFNTHSHGEPLQISFPLFTDTKVTDRGMLGPCVRVTGPPEKLYVLTLRYEVSAHLRAGRAMTLVRDRPVVEAGRNERFSLLGEGGEAEQGRRRAGSAAGLLGSLSFDRDGRESWYRGPRRGRVRRARGERGRERWVGRSARLLRAEDRARDEVSRGCCAARRSA